MRIELEITENESLFIGKITGFKLVIHWLIWVKAYFTP